MDYSFKRNWRLFSFFSSFVFSLFLSEPFSILQRRSMNNTCRNGKKTNMNNGRVKNRAIIFFASWCPYNRRWLWISRRYTSKGNNPNFWGIVEKFDNRERTWVGSRYCGRVVVCSVRGDVPSPRAFYTLALVMIKQRSAS